VNSGAAAFVARKRPLRALAQARYLRPEPLDQFDHGQPPPTMGPAEEPEHTDRHGRVVRKRPVRGDARVTEHSIEPNPIRLCLRRQPLDRKSAETETTLK
jgi:hypothetical protein